MYFNKEEDLKTSLDLQNSLTDVVAMLGKASKVLKAYDKTVSSTAGGPTTGPTITAGASSSGTSGKPLNQCDLSAPVMALQ
jgi:hypothetical protein